VDSRGRGTVVIKRFARELSLQHHLCARWEDEVIKEAGGAGCLVESEFLQGGEADPFPGRGGRWLGKVREAELDEFERGAPFEEGC